jgi:hypothetical protein
MGQNPLVIVLAYYTTGYLTEVSCNFFWGEILILLLTDKYF